METMRKNMLLKMTGHSGAGVIECPTCARSMPKISKGGVMKKASKKVKAVKKVKKVKKKRGGMILGGYDSDSEEEYEYQEVKERQPNKWNKFVKECCCEFKNYNPNYMGEMFEGNNAEMLKMLGGYYKESDKNAKEALKLLRQDLSEL